MELPIEFTPPRDHDAERSVLGAILLDWATAYSQVELSPNDFELSEHQSIFSCMQTIADSGIPVDVVTLYNELRHQQLDEKCGGAAYLAELNEFIPTTHHVKFHADIVRNCSLLRKALSYAQKTRELIYTSPDDPVDIISTVQEMFLSITKGYVQNGLASYRDLLEDGVKRIEDRYANKTYVPGLRSGIADLDRKTGGFKPGELWLIAGRPGMGKTSFAQQCLHESAKDGASVLFISLEMAEDQIIDRALSLEGSVDSMKLRTGYITYEELEDVTKAADRLKDLKIWIDRSRFLTAKEVGLRARQLATQHSISMICIDYLQLLDSDGNVRNQNRVQEISKMSRSLKGIALSLGVPVLALSQLSRECEKREDKRPQLSDLRESGALEQDADGVLLLYRDDYYKPDTAEAGEAEIIIAKQRNGDIGKIFVNFQKEFTRFQDMYHGPNYDNISDNDPF